MSRSVAERRVLIASDRPIVARGLASVLEHDGRCVTETQRASVALRSPLEADVILLDEAGCRSDAAISRWRNAQPPAPIVLLQPPDAERSFENEFALNVASLVSMSDTSSDLVEAILSASMSDGSSVEREAPDTAPDPLAVLSARETEVLDLLVGGARADAAAEMLGISHATVRAHIRNACRRLGVSSRAEVMELFAQRRDASTENGERYERPSFGRSGARSVALVSAEGLGRDSIRASVGGCPAVAVTDTNDNLEDLAARIPGKHIDVVILDEFSAADHQMIEQWRARRGAAPVLVLGEADDRDSVCRAFVNGAMGYVALTESAEALTTAIHALAIGEAHVPPGRLGTLLTDLTDYWAARVEAVRASSLLSARERTVFELMSEGKREAEIAEALFIAPSTARSHMSSVNRKLNRR